MPFSTEEQIILLSSRLNPSSRDLELVEQLVASTSTQIDFRKLIDLASRNGVVPFLYENLKNVGMLPEKVSSKLRNIYLYSVAGNLRKLNELLSLLDLLNYSGIDAIPLKGAFASEVIFENPGLYYGADIDILIRPSDLDKVKHILMNKGYRYNEENELDMLSSHYHLIFYNDRHIVEVHWNLVKRYFDIPAEFWWEDTLIEPYQGYEILYLSPEKYLICAIFRLFSHMFKPLKFFVLISELCNKYYNKINWNRLLKVTEQHGMKKLTIFSLKLSNELLGTKVPNDILDKTIAGYNLFKNSIVHQLFGDVRRPHMGKLLFVFLLDSPLSIFSHFCKRLFPEKGELRLRYRIPESSRTLFFYYAFNPFLLPLLVLRKRLDARSGKSQNR
jgi:hypothetical protein